MDQLNRKYAYLFRDVKGLPSVNGSPKQVYEICMANKDNTGILEFIPDILWEYLSTGTGGKYTQLIWNIPIIHDYHHYLMETLLIDRRGINYSGLRQVRDKINCATCRNLVNRLL